MNKSVLPLVCPEQMEWRFCETHAQKATMFPCSLFQVTQINFPELVAWMVAQMIT